MKIIKYFRMSFMQVISLICVIGFFLGVMNVYFSDKTNYCAMTYMYEYPQFVRIHFRDNIHYPAYGLYSYSEGRLTERARKMRFDGIPVVFLPGNGGSHMQARSLASIALRKALSKGYDYHFDYFTLSYNEELSGLFGGTLSKQVEFAALCITKILDLYTVNKYTKHVPTHVIIIGHSMGGVIGSRLLAHRSTLNSTRIAIALAAPLEAPLVLFDNNYNSFYRNMREDWKINVNGNAEVKDRKILISFGNGPRDVLVPSGLTSYNNSFISALTTAVPGVWVSPDHVCIVWCKQMVMAINKYLFSLVDLQTLQISDDMAFVKEKARRYFVANRSMSLDPSNHLETAAMVADAFWYEDNRRIYQVARPGIEKMTYLMIRLVGFPQNRFVAIEGTNVEDHDWIYGCNARDTYNVHRYCKQAASLSQLSRWTAAANNFGKRKLATINLHDLKKQHPDWTHVIVKVSPTKKPVTLNVDINDHASRQISVTTPSPLSLGKHTVIPHTEAGSLYYELILNEFSTLPEAYSLFVEPSGACAEYHVSAEAHVPWAPNYEYTHYFTHLKQTPMKLRLFRTNSNVTDGEPMSQHVKVTLLLDPRCSFTVSISSSWYHSLGQLVRNYTPLLLPYSVGIVLMAAACNLNYLYNTRSCVSIHTAMDSKMLRPYYVLLLAKLMFIAIMYIPLLCFLFDHSTTENRELQWVARSWLVLPTYLVAFGVLNVSTVGMLCAIAFSSQLDRLIFRIFWRGSTSVSEKVAYALRKVPMVLSAVMLAAVPMSCGAASLAIGAAFYAYMISRMFEDYFEDIGYKLVAKVASYLCRLVNRKSQPTPTNANGEEIKWRNLKELEREGDRKPKPKRVNSRNKDEDWSNLNFHMMMFSVWVVSAILNMPTLLGWAKNFKFETKLSADPSFDAGIVLSACSGYIWQLDGPRQDLKHYPHLSMLIYAIGIFVIVIGPFSLAVANYCVIFIFCMLTLQQLFDCEQNPNDDLNESNNRENRQKHNGRKECHSTSVLIGEYVCRQLANLLNGRYEANKDSGSENNTSVNEGKSDKREGKSENEKSKGDNGEGKSDNEKGKSDNGEGKSDNDAGRNDNGEGNSDNDVGKKDKGDLNTHSSKANEPITPGSVESCDVCDESRIYTAFKNLREKLSFND